ncbi:amino acid adenylation domain protein [Chondrocystis sp. NIES-4102]|nr:amino acid adenylation domain protein [Chondrocystis sp. NIES-4102]
MEKLTNNGFAISPQQQNIWLSSTPDIRQKLQVTGTILLSGELDLVTLEKVIKQVINKHEILRTKLSAIAALDIPMQVIDHHDNFSLDIGEIDDQGEFNLEEGIFYARLIKIKPKSNILAIAISAFCVDPISFVNLVQEISQAYQSYAVDNDPLQYADLAAWQNELLTTAPAVARQYWQDKNSLLNFKVTHPVEFIPQVVNCNLNNDLLDQIQLFASENNTSIANILMGTWQLLLWRLFSKQDLVVATYFENRNYQELKSVIGLLAKYIPVQIELTPDLTFSQLISKLDTEITQINQWQEYYIPTQDHISPPYGFEFNLLPATYQTPDLTFTIQNIFNYCDRYQLKLGTWYGQNSLLIQFYYNNYLFSPEDIKTLTQQYQTLLESALNQPENTITQLNILNPKQQQQLLIKFNQTPKLTPPYPSLHNWFEAQVNKTPEATAVIFEEQQLTYQQLNTKAENLANYLISLGIKSETIIALCVERSLDIVIGIIGILKAGAAYLPIEPSLPNAAINFRLQDAQAAIILTQKHLQTKITAANNQIPIITLDNNFKSSPTQKLSPNLAYIIYTSGSTGKPKGVAVEHRQIINYLTGALAKLNLPEAASFAMVSTFAADLGNTSMFACLCTGGCLHIISEGKATDPIALGDYFSKHKIDCLKIVPSHLCALLTDVNAQNILPRQRLILGGEAATWELVEKVQQLAPNCQIYNHYGPTETTIGVLINQIDLQEKNDSTSPLLGSPIANTQIYILDQQQLPVPIGIAGEIYIGGANLARGYINQPQLNSEKFIINPLLKQYNQEQQYLAPLVYKTGDLGRYLPSGKIEFLGRIDHQIKLHGYRIEPEEITSILRKHPQVINAVVTVREKSNNPYLVAYLIANSEITTDLKDFLRNKLPEYMLPSFYVQLSSFPLTSNGKIDLHSLPLPATITEDTSTFIAPRNQIEETLTQIWSKLLGKETISIEDNFFSLGGDSIISIQAIALANQAGLRLTPKQIFEHQTIAQLAKYAEVNYSYHTEQGIVTGIVPLTPIQHSFFEQDLVAPQQYCQSVFLEFKKEIAPQQLASAINYLLEHHDVLRSKFGVSVAHGESEITPSIPVIEITHFPSYKEDIATKIQSSLDLASGKLIKIATFNLDANQGQLLLIVIHHLLIDGVSWRILLDDLQTALTQINQGQTIQLPAKTTSYKYWAQRLQQYAQTAIVKDELNYWLNLLASARSLTPLPVDFPNSEGRVGDTAMLSCCFSPDETQAILRKNIPSYHAQFNNIILAAIVKTFCDWTGKSQLLINLEGHGREDIFADVDLSRTVGWFTTVFPVLLDLKQACCHQEIIQTIEEQIERIPHKGIGYGLLRYLNQDKTISQALANTAQAEICFNYLGQFDNLLTSPWFKLPSELGNSPPNIINQSRYLLNINAYIIEGQLKLDWVYNSGKYREATIAKLIKSYQEIIRNIIETEKTVIGNTPSDFPQANLNQEQLDQFLATLD